MCSQELLLQSTFYHVPRKFGIIDPYATIEPWMRTALASYIRFCPYCLLQDSYYKLCWRFLSLLGCVKHRCQLLDCCGYCGIRIPIFPEDLRIGICPGCKKELCELPSPSLSNDDYNISIAHQRDLEFLLSPSEFENIPAITFAGSIIFALHYAMIRRQRRESRESVAKSTGLTEHRISMIESRGGYGKSIQNYILLARHYNISLYNIFHEIQEKINLINLPHSSEEELPQLQDILSRLREEYYVSDVKHTIDRASPSDNYIPRSLIAKDIGIHPQYMARMPKIQKILIEEVTTNKKHTRGYKSSREDHYLDMVRIAITTLKLQNKRITITAICNITEITANTLCRYRKIKELLESEVDTIVVNITRRRSKREADLMRQAQEAIELFEEYGDRITKTAIARRLHLSVSGLALFPSVVSLVEDAQKKAFSRDAPQQKTHNKPRTTSPDNVELDSPILHFPGVDQEIQGGEIPLHVKVQEAIQLIKAEGHKVTVRRISQLTGVLHKKLYADSQVKQILDQEVDSSLYHVHADREKFEIIVVRRVQAAIQTLREADQLVTQRAIMKIVGISRETLRKYDSVREILERELDTLPTKRQKRNQEKTQMLIEQMKQVIQDLQSQNEKVTLRAISEQVGVSRATFKRNTQIREFLEKALGIDCFKDPERQQQRGKEDLDLVQNSIEQLRMEKRHISWSTVSQVSGVRHQSLKRNPQIRAIISEAIEGQGECTRLRRVVNEDELYNAVKNAVDQLQTTGEKVTERAICVIVDRSSGVLRYHPRVRGLLEQHVPAFNSQQRKKSTR